MNENKKDFVTFVSEPSATLELNNISEEISEESEELSPEEDLPEILQFSHSTQLDQSEIESSIEALLFMADKPLSIDHLRDFIGDHLFESEVFTQALESLKSRYQSLSHGIEIVEIGGGLQLRTKLIRAPLGKKLAKIQTQRLSRGAMETLAIAAYKQPVMKEEIDKVRGVDSSHFIRTLLDKKMIAITGRSELPGRPMLYATTAEFLQLFGLKDLAALPPLSELEQMVPSSEVQEEDPKVREMRKLVEKMTTDTQETLHYDPREDDKILREIREKVSAIQTSTPSIEEQKQLEKQNLQNMTTQVLTGQAESGI